MVKLTRAFRFLLPAPATAKTTMGKERQGSRVTHPTESNDLGG